MSKNILVTGIEGFIGSNFALQAKKKNYNIVGLTWEKPNWKVVDYEINLFEITKDLELEAVVHFGAIASTRFINKQMLYGFNVEAVQVIANFCALKNTPLIFTSSAAIYGNAGNYLSPYAKSKVQGELILKNTPKLKFASLRLFNTYGFNEIHKQDMKSLISDMIISSLQNKEILIWKLDNLQAGLQSRDFINVLDVNEIILKLVIEARYTNEALDLGTGKSYKFIDLANFIALINPEIEIKLADPPIEYDRSSYQRYTRADMSWLDAFDIRIAPLDPYKIIPGLINQYKDFLEFENTFKLR